MLFRCQDSHLKHIIRTKCFVPSKNLCNLCSEAGLTVLKELWLIQYRVVSTAAHYKQGVFDYWGNFPHIYFHLFCSWCGSFLYFFISFPDNNRSLPRSCLHSFDNNKMWGNILFRSVCVWSLIKRLEQSQLSDSNMLLQTQCLNDIKKHSQFCLSAPGTITIIWLWA